LTGDVTNANQCLVLADWIFFREMYILKLQLLYNENNTKFRSMFVLINNVDACSVG